MRRGVAGWEGRVAVLPALRHAAAFSRAGEPVGGDGWGAGRWAGRHGEHRHAASAAAAAGGVEDGNPVRGAGCGNWIGAEPGGDARGCAVAGESAVDHECVDDYD